MAALIFVYLFLAILLLSGVIYFLKSGYLAHRLLHLKKLVTLRISLPQQHLSSAHDIGKTQQLIENFSGFKGPVAVEFFTPPLHTAAHFHLAIPKGAIKFITARLKKIWPNLRVESDSDASFFHSGTTLKGAYLLRVSQEFESMIDTEDPSFFIKLIKNFLKAKNIGESLILQLIFEPTRLQPAKKIKGAKSIFLANLRILAAATTEFQADELLNNLSSYFKNFKIHESPVFKVIKQRNPKKLVHQFVFREIDQSQALFLTAREIAILSPLNASFN